MKSGCKLVGVRRRWALVSAAAAVGLPVIGTAVPALGDISITYSTVGSSQLFLPQTGTYTVEVAGAQGGSNGPIYTGGFGAIIEGTTANFTSRDSVSFYVGGQGQGTSDFSLGAGGGGGSFLYDNTTSSLLVAAGGGGGEGGGTNGGVGETTNAGAAGSSGLGDTGGTGGSGGNGGQVGTSGDGGGGGGLLTAGQSSSGFGVTATGGGAFSGLAGGTTTEPGLTAVTGGFGGGGAAGITSGGGGGGYSGGGGGGGAGGGGGGSFLASSVTGSGSFAGANSGNGFIIFSPTTFNMTIVYGSAGTIAGAISGGGAVNMTGTGNAVLTSNSNSWTGGMTISSGTITVGDGGNDGSLPGNVTNNSKLVFNSSGTVTASGNLSGTGTLTQSGSGTTILSGTNSSYTGIATISSGTLQLGNNGSTGIIPGNIVDNAALVMDFSSAQTYAGIISGSGSFAAAGSGVVYLTNQSTYSGSTTVGNTALLTEINNAIPVTTSLIGSGGNFVIGAGGASPVAQTVASLSGSGDISGGVANATFTLNQSGTTVYSGNFQQSGGSTLSFTKQGAGTLILTGSSTYTGSTTLSAGSLQFGNGGTTGSITTNITDNANLTFDRTDSFTYGGNITGTGSLTQSGSGTVALTGTNSFTGGTTISAGSLQLGSGGATGSITGNVTDNGNLTFDLTTNPTISSKISGSGSLTQSGSGDVTLTSSNTYAGNTTINAGVLIAGVTNALPTTTNLIMNSGYLGLNTNVTQTVASLSGAGSGIGMSPNGILIVNQSTNTEFDGFLYDGNDFGQPTDVGQLIKQGSGRLTLTGTNVYGGGTTISGGTLQIGNGGTTGSVTGNFTDNANLAFDRSDSFTVSGKISGSGSLTQLGTGTMVVTGSLSHTGGTTISAGSLQIGNGTTAGSITGNVTDNANLTFDNPSGNNFYSGVISGTGSLTQSGGDALILESANTYMGNTAITSSGSIFSSVNNALPVTTSLNVGSGFFVFNAGNLSQTVASLTGSGAIEAPGGLVNNTFTVNQTSNTVYSGSILDGTAFGDTGSLQLVKQGNGNLTLTNSDVYAGGTTVSAGTLQLGNGAASGSVAGNILNNAQLTFDRSDAFTYPSAISGTGSVTQKGTGTLVFTGTNSYSGGTTINTGGTLQLGNGGTTGIISNTGGIVDNGNITFDRTDSFAFGGYIHGNGSLTQSGTGTVNLTTSNSYLGATNVTAGKLIIGAVNGIAYSPVSISGGGILQLAANTGEEDITGLSITTGSALDINNNHVFINYGSGADPITSVAAWIASGYAGGAWNGSGILSTTAQTNGGSYGIGYADSADPNNPAGLASGTIEIMYTLLGDANLDGSVNGTDFAILASNFNKADQAGYSGWDEGDFNYDGSVNGSDFAALASNFNKGASQASDLAALDSFASAHGLLADVPEPGIVGLLLPVGYCLLMNRRRRIRVT